MQYDKLIEATRAQVERRGAQHRTRGQRWLRAAIFALFPHPRRLRAVRGPLWLYQRSGLSAPSDGPGCWSAFRRRWPRWRRWLRRSPAREPIAERTPAHGETRMVVGMLLGCVQRELFPGVNAATVRVLTMEGCEVVAPAAQRCCGALSVHNGRDARGRADTPDG